MLPDLLGAMCVASDSLAAQMWIGTSSTSIAFFLKRGRMASRLPVRRVPRCLSCLPLRIELVCTAPKSIRDPTLRGGTRELVMQVVLRPQLIFPSHYHRTPPSSLSQYSFIPCCILAIHSHVSAFKLHRTFYPCSNNLRTSPMYPHDN